MDPTTPIEETLEAPHDVVKAGKARYLGASSMHAWEFSKALYLQRTHGWARFVSMQDQDSDHAIIDAVGEIAQLRGVSRAQVALAASVRRVLVTRYSTFIDVFLALQRVHQQIRPKGLPYFAM